MTPPDLRTRLTYQVFGIAPPAVYRGWVERDLASASWRFRRALQYWIATAVAVGLMLLMFGGGSDSPLGRSFEGALIGAAIGGFIGGILHATVLAERSRQRVLAYYDRKWTQQLTV